MNAFNVLKKIGLYLILVMFLSSAKDAVAQSDIIDVPVFWYDYGYVPGTRTF